MTYMRQSEIDQKFKEKPQNRVASVQTDNPIPISLNGFTLQNIIVVLGLIFNLIIVIINHNNHAVHVQGNDSLEILVLE